jgi:hypothetical protein
MAKIKTSSAMMITWQDRKCKIQESRKQLTAENHEMRNHDLIFISKFQILGVGGVKETHDKNDETTK